MDTNDRSELDRAITERFSACRPDDDWHPDFHRGLTLLRERRAAATGLRRSWMFVVVTALAAAVPIMAFPVTRAFAGHCVSVCVQETLAVRQLLLGSSTSSTPSSTFVPSSDRRMAPDFTLTDASGRIVKLSGFRGKAVLLNFWATWCWPCEQEIPWFTGFQRANEGRGFTVLGIAMDKSGWSAVKPYTDRKRVNYPVMLGNDEVAASFGGLHSIPLTLVIDRSGRIAAIHAGLCRKDEYEGDINAVLNEQ
jgi:peroxiredoxin